MITENDAGMPVKMESLCPTSKARRGASRNKFIEKSGMPDRAISLRKVDRSKNRPRARLGFVKLI